MRGIKIQYYCQFQLEGRCTNWKLFRISDSEQRYNHKLIRLIIMWLWVNVIIFVLFLYYFSWNTPALPQFYITPLTNIRYISDNECIIYTYSSGKVWIFTQLFIFYLSVIIIKRNTLTIISWHAYKSITTISSLMAVIY